MLRLRDGLDEEGAAAFLAKDEGDGADEKEGENGDEDGDAAIGGRAERIGAFLGMRGFCGHGGRQGSRLTRRPVWKSMRR